MRDERSRSKLFPVGENSIWAGETKNLTYESGHFTGSKTIAGTLVVPNEEEDKFRIEIGRPSLKGVEPIGSTSGTFSATSAVSVTPHANTQVGDLMVLYVGHVSTNQGQMVTPGAGWHRVWKGELVTDQSWGAVFMRMRRENDLTSYRLGKVSDLDLAESAVYLCVTYRNAQIQHEENLNIVEATGAAGSTATFTELGNVPDGSCVMQAVFSGTSGGASTSHTGYGTGFVELSDAFVTATNAVAMGVAHKEIPTGGTVALENIAMGATVDVWRSLAFVIEPKSSGIYGWTGEAGSETFFINEHGTASIKNIVGDVNISGNLRYQKPLVLVCKNAGQSCPNNTQTQITFATPTIDDQFLFNDSTDAFDFDGELHRGLWRVELFVTWVGNTTVGARFLAEIVDVNAGFLTVARDNRRAAGTGIDCARAVYILPVTEDTSLEFYATHNGGAGIDIDGSEDQTNTTVFAEYLRDLD